MTRLIPAICFACAVVSAVMSIASLVFVSVCALSPSLTGLTVFAVPLLVASTVTAGLSALVNFLFLKDRLCKAGFVIALVSVATVIVAYAVILTM